MPRSNKISQSWADIPFDDSDSESDDDQPEPEPSNKRQFSRERATLSASQSVETMTQRKSLPPTVSTVVQKSLSYAVMLGVSTPKPVSEPAPKPEQPEPFGRKKKVAEPAPTPALAAYHGSESIDALVTHITYTINGLVNATSEIRNLATEFANRRAPMPTKFNAEQRVEALRMLCDIMNNTHISMETRSKASTLMPGMFRNTCV